MDYSALKKTIQNGKKEYKVYEDADKALEELASVEQYKTDLEKQIKKLSTEVSKSDEIVKKANEEAKSVKSEADDYAKKIKEKAGNVLEKAEEKADKMIADAESKVSEITQPIASLKADLEALRLDVSTIEKLHAEKKREYEAFLAKFK